MQSYYITYALYTLSQSFVEHNYAFSYPNNYFSSDKFFTFTGRMPCIRYIRGNCAGRMAHTRYKQSHCARTYAPYMVHAECTPFYSVVF